MEPKDIIGNIADVSVLMDEKIRYKIIRMGVDPDIFAGAKLLEFGEGAIVIERPSEEIVNIYISNSFKSTLYKIYGSNSGGLSDEQLNEGI